MGRCWRLSGYHEVLLLKADGSELVARLVGLSERIQSLRFSPDGKLLAVAGGSPGADGRDADLGRRRAGSCVLSVPSTLRHAVRSKLVARRLEDRIRLRSTTPCARSTPRPAQQVLYQGAHNDWVLDTVFSIDSSHLVSVSRDRSMKLIEVATQRFVDNITSITPGALEGWAGGGRSASRRRTSLLVGGADGQPKLFRMYRPADKARQIGDDFNKIRDFEPLPGRIYHAEFNHDGSQIVVGSSNDGTGEVRVYQDRRRQGVSKFEGQPGPVYAATFNHDGKTVAAGGFDGKVLLIDAATGKLVKEFVPFPATNSGVGQ